MGYGVDAQMLYELVAGLENERRRRKKVEEGEGDKR
jgi:hypothetical protein